MAVDPLTAKILAKVAMQAATDSESRKRILFMILAPVLGLLLLIAFILYLITSPFSVLSQWLIGDEVSVVEDFQKARAMRAASLQMGQPKLSTITSWMSGGQIFRMEPIISAVMAVARLLWRLWYPA